MNKLDQYSDVITRLLKESIACTPQEWTRGTLTIDCDGVRIDYKLKNDEQPGTASISDTLKSLIEELYVRMAQQGDLWTQARLSFSEGDDGWQYGLDFRYPDKAADTAAAAPPQPAPVKSKWKFWQ